MTGRFRNRWLNRQPIAKPARALVQTLVILRRLAIKNAGQDICQNAGEYEEKDKPADLIVEGPRHRLWKVFSDVLDHLKDSRGQRR